MYDAMEKTGGIELFTEWLSDGRPIRRWRGLRVDGVVGG